MSTKPPTRRSALHVDLGAELEAQLRAAAAAQCVSPSQWTRAAIQEGLLAGAPSAVTQLKAEAPIHPQTQEGASRAQASPKSERISRLDLDAELAQMLEAINTKGQFRNRPAALRLVLRQYLCQMQGQGQTTPAAADVAPLKDAVAALMRSNHELVPMGRNLTQVAKSLHQQRVSLRVIDVMKLEAVAKRLKEHVAQASQVTAALRSLVTPKKDPP